MRQREKTLKYSFKPNSSIANKIFIKTLRILRKTDTLHTEVKVKNSIIKNQNGSEKWGQKITVTNIVF